MATASAPETEPPFKEVQLEALVVAKVIKDCSEKFPTTATGFLVGMENKGTLEVTNSFNFPIVDLPLEAQFDHQHFNAAAAMPRHKSNTQYQADMIKMLREVNVDANNVGWYTSANLGNFINLNFIENQYHYQKDLNEKTVALVHDTTRNQQGPASFKAFRLTPQFMAAYKDNKFTTESLQKSGLKYTEILIEIPVKIHNSLGVQTFLGQVPRLIQKGMIKPPSSAAQVSRHPAVLADHLAPNFEKLAISIDPFLSQICDQVLDSVETHHVESNNFSYYQRALAREQAKIQQWQAKRKAENAARALAKQPPLPEDEWQRLFKLPQEPSRLESMLNSRQVEQYARQVDGFAAGTSAKMFAVRGNLLPGDNADIPDEDAE